MTNSFCELLFSKLDENERVFKFKRSSLDKDKLTVELIISSSKYAELFTEESNLQERLDAYAKEIVPEDVKVKIKVTKTSLDKTNLINLIFNYIDDNQNLMRQYYMNNENYDIEVTDDNKCNIFITLEETPYEYAKSIDLGKKLKEYLDLNVIEECNVFFRSIPNKESFTPEEIQIVNTSTIRMIPISNVKVLTSANTIPRPRYICDVMEKNRATDEIWICGKVERPQRRQMDPTKFRNREVDLYTFYLNDTTQTVKCKYFGYITNKKEVNWIDVFVEGKEICVGGKYTYDERFEKGFVFNVTQVCTCNIDTSEVDVKSNFNIDKGRYQYIMPQKYKSELQAGLFESSIEQNEALMNNDYVVFDLETTGKYTDTAEIVEIGAIKIHKGQFIESFSTLVKPEHPIPREATAVNNITNEMVEDAPTLDKVIPDFYRFCKGTVLVGHNSAQYDIPVLNKQSYRIKYDFDNRNMDTMLMAQSKLPIKKVALSNVAEYFNITIQNAHRSMGDVEATAKVFIKLMTI